MDIQFEVIPQERIHVVKNLCNELMAYQQSKARIHPEWFDGMRFETRLVPSVENAKANHLVVAMDGGEAVGYAYSNISSKYVYSNSFATLDCDAFFDFDSVKGEDVGCLSQFFIKEAYRNRGIGSELFRRAVEWLRSFDSVEDVFIFVSNGNDDALRFYLRKGFRISHEILDGFITVLRNRAGDAAS
ncbi:GNAT family N-acetyltransferase [Staphylospora marina]|uniref:GNAT family N-acetyltransferase n=1 Tax=Staphylospora marina TaxID=2490858 RepID=UPI0013DDD047|nr:GNAT family N-acetyltransferase [Staphylospora marina]